MAPRRFNPSLWSTLAAVAGVAATIGLGYWQLGRAQEKSELLVAREAAAQQPPVQLGQARVDAASVEERQVEARGRFVTRGMVLLDNRVRSGFAGYEVIMPLALTGGEMHVLVNRGWVRGTGDRARLPEIDTPAGEVLVAGLAVVPGRKIYELSDDRVEGQVWQNLTLERYRAHTGYALQPIMIQQTNDTGDGLAREWPTPARSINVHRGYAFQWFAFAVLIAVAYVWFALRRDPAKR
ncbi:MAG: SURF1 family protein [Betaproteobacteria bacterium]|nr:SURF1 family protein [Betaproteobacteria bacterium]